MTKQIYVPGNAEDRHYRLPAILEELSSSQTSIGIQLALGEAANELRRLRLVSSANDAIQKKLWEMIEDLTRQLGENRK